MNASEKSFRLFLASFGRPDVRADLIILACLAAAAGTAFRLLYPFMFTFPDSGAYVLGAAEGVFNAYRPMGYSSYLKIVHLFTGSEAGLFAVSYTLSALSSLFMLFSARYLLDISPRWLFLTLSALTLLSPRIIFCTNFIMSDGLFNTLTMLFLASAMWMVFARNLLMAAFHLLLFAALYKVRFSGMFFIPVSVAAMWFCFARGKASVRLCAAAAPVVLFVALFSSARKEYVRQTGVDTFAAFGGWQTVNNASVLLPEAKSIDPKELDFGLRLLHAFIRQCPDAMFADSSAMRTDYMWSNNLPYKQFLFYYMQSTGKDYQRAWVETGRMYGEYGRALVARYPGRYFVRFVAPSLLSAFRCGDMYEEKGEFRNEPLYKDYFGIQEASYRHENRVFTAIYPLRKLLNVLFWAALGVCAAWFCAARCRRGLPRFEERLAAGMLLGFAVIYIGSSALASPTTSWRYMMPVMVPSLVFIFYCISDWIRSKAE